MFPRLFGKQRFESMQTACYNALRETIGMLAVCQLACA
jgi:hypothetical protein